MQKAKKREKINKKNRYISASLSVLSGSISIHYAMDYFVTDWGDANGNIDNGR